MPPPPPAPVPAVAEYARAESFFITIRSTMKMHHRRHRTRSLRTTVVATVLLVSCAVLATATGCYHVDRRGERLVNSLPAVRVVVVAPMMNLSTNPHVDLVAMSNAFYSELSQVEGLTVVPISRVYEYLVRQEQATV